METVIGLKLLRSDYSSLSDTHGRVVYGTDWQEVPGDGAFVAVSDGLGAEGIGLVCAALECHTPTGAPAFGGVVCFRWVRRLKEIPWDRLTPEQCGMAGLWADNLTEAERDRCIDGTTPEWRGMIGCYRDGLTRAQRDRCIDGTIPEWRGEIGCRRDDLTRAQRNRCIRGTTPNRRGYIGAYCERLTRAQRDWCIDGTTPYWRRLIGYCRIDLTKDQRARCRA